MGNDSLAETEWLNTAHMRVMANRPLAGVADMMRYEILYHHGGLAVDADSRCVRPLEDWLLEPDELAVWENEMIRPGLVANDYLGAQPESPLMGTLIKEIFDSPTVLEPAAWVTVGPQLLTDVWRKFQFPLTVYPLHYFKPTHYTGQSYRGVGQSSPSCCRPEQRAR